MTSRFRRGDVGQGERRLGANVPGGWKHRSKRGDRFLDREIVLRALDGHGEDVAVEQFDARIGIEGTVFGSSLELLARPAHQFERSRSRRVNKYRGGHGGAVWEKNGGQNRKSKRQSSRDRERGQLVDSSKPGEKENPGVAVPPGRSL